ncbi:hypothetical protein [Sorangium sp. So ce341]
MERFDIYLILHPPVVSTGQMHTGLQASHGPRWHAVDPRSSIAEAKG